MSQNLAEKIHAAAGSSSPTSIRSAKMRLRTAKLTLDVLKLGVLKIVKITQMLRANPTTKTPNRLTKDTDKTLT